MPGYKKAALIVLFILGLCSTSFGQSLISLSYERDTKSERIDDPFQTREVQKEHRFSLGYRKGITNRFSIGVNYSFTYGRIFPHLTSFLEAQNYKTYHRLGIDGDFNFSTGKLTPFIFGNLGLIFNYPGELSSYERTNNFALGLRVGPGLKYNLDLWTFKLMYSFGQILNPNSYEVQEDLQLLGIGTSFKIIR